MKEVEKMILNHCRLVSALSGGIQSENGSVEVRDGKIVKVSSSPVAEGGSFDCQGKTLLPGLIDLHTHITVLGGVGADKLHTPMGLLVTAAEHVTHYLDHGFTTIRDCGSSLRAANFVRDMVKNGSLEAPDIISCGRAIMTTEVEEGNPLASHLAFADGCDEMTKAVRREAAEQADFIKIFTSGAAANPSGIPTQAIMNRTELHAIVEAAAMKDKYVAAHCHSDAAIRLCIESGVKTIEHATYLSDESLEMVMDKKDCYLIPTLAVMYIGDGPRKEYWSKRLGPMFRHCTEAMEKAYSAGEILGFGTDCCAGDDCYENGIEFRFRRENCHMKDVDILLQATKYNARIAGIEDQVGEIKEGLNANLILIDGKPDEDISAMYGRPDKVWKNGRLVREAIV